jgi:outer membrane protein assembly factor BamB
MDAIATDYPTHATATRYLDEKSGCYYVYDPITGEVNWENNTTAPAYSPDAAYQDAILHEAGGESSMDDSSPIKRFFDESSGQYYIYNSETGEVTWEVDPAAAAGGGVADLPIESEDSILSAINQQLALPDPSLDLQDHQGNMPYVYTSISLKII